MVQGFDECPASRAQCPDALVRSAYSIDKYSKYFKSINVLNKYIPFKLLVTLGSPTLHLMNFEETWSLLKACYTLRKEMIGCSGEESIGQQVNMLTKIAFG